MSHLTTAPPAAPTATTARTVARWMVSFAGFPLGGFAALTPDRTRSTAPATPSSAVSSPAPCSAPSRPGRCAPTAASSWRGSWPPRSAWPPGSPSAPRWSDFSTGLGDLAVQGAVTGALVGLAQAVVLRPAGLVALVWPLYLAAAWALGWVVTTPSASRSTSSSPSSAPPAP